MKKIIVLAIFSLLCLGACQKDHVSPMGQQTPPVVEDTPILSQEEEEPTNKNNSMTEYAVTPKFGKPNSTYYYFRVYSLSSLPISVKLYNKATGQVSYLAMSRSGNFWVLSTRISANGWYDWRYVYSSNNANISNNAYTLCNSNNMFNSSPYSISWPFGADGSSWNNRTINQQTWKGGQEGGSGYGWNQGTHTGTAERYSDDWNRGIGTQDLGAIIRSPLDGYIETIGTYTVSGYSTPSKYVSIIQEGSDGKRYRFYVSHLQTTASGLYSGKYVRAGVDQIGTLGSSGTSSPHAHTNMRVNGVSVPFYFNAQ